MTSENEVFIKLLDYMTEVVETNQSSTLSATTFYDEFKSRFKLNTLQEIASALIKPTVLVLLNIFSNIPQDKTVLLKTNKNNDYIISICNDVFITSHREKAIKIITFIMSTLFNKLQKPKYGGNRETFDTKLRENIGNTISENIVRLYYVWMNLVDTQLYHGQQRNNKTRKYKIQYKSHCKTQKIKTNI